MKNNFWETIEKYPSSDVFAYWDWIEFFLRFEPWKWWFKISWTQEQVKKSINLIVERSKKDWTKSPL